MPRPLNRLQAIVFTLIAVGIGVCAMWAYFHDHGGTPWARVHAQSVMIQAINGRYPGRQYNVVMRATYNRNLHRFELGVIYDDDPTHEHIYAMPESTGIVKESEIRPSPSASQ